MLLCDHAEVVQGKLYIMGGGWSRITPDTPSHIGIALHLQLSHDEAKNEHTFRLVLLNEEKEAVEIEGDTVVIDGKFGTKLRPEASDADLHYVPFALNINILIPSGRFSWVFEVDGEEVTSMSFAAAPPPA